MTLQGMDGLRNHFTSTTDLTFAFRNGETFSSAFVEITVDGTTFVGVTRDSKVMKVQLGDLSEVYASKLSLWKSLGLFGIVGLTIAAAGFIAIVVAYFVTFNR